MNTFLNRISTLPAAAILMAMMSMPVSASPPAARAQDHSAAENVTRIVELTPYADAYIHGVVVKLLDEDEFRLEDASGKIKVYTGWKNTNTVKLGETVTVKGILDPGIIKEFYASEIRKENGEIIRLESDG